MTDLAMCTRYLIEKFKNKWWKNCSGDKKDVRRIVKPQNFNVVKKRYLREGNKFWNTLASYDYIAKIMKMYLYQSFTPWRNLIEML